MKPSLDKDKIKVLLRKADSQWYRRRVPNKYDYEGQLEHTATYLAQNYDKGGNHEKHTPTPQGHTAKRQDRSTGKEAAKGTRLL